MLPLYENLIEGSGDYPDACRSMGVSINFNIEITPFLLDKENHNDEKLMPH
jgi:hypothetical protein